MAAATGLGLAGCSADLPPEALAAWAGPGAAPVPNEDPRRWLLAHAILAPHSHNLQSWLVDLREADAITLYCDRSRLLPETDPFSRQMMMSQGTFLEALDLAAREIGLAADITLFPSGTPGPEQLTDAPTARIRLRRDQGSHPDPLFRQILLRRTNRSPYEARSPATAHGLSMHPLQQALQEYPEQAEWHRRIHALSGASGPGQTVQMWAGWAMRRRWHPHPGAAWHRISSRRDLEPTMPRKTWPPSDTPRSTCSTAPNTISRAPASRACARKQVGEITPCDSSSIRQFDGTALFPTA